MASDQDYMSFLDKANEDPSKGQAQVKQQQGNTAGASKKKFRTTQEGVEVPACLARVCGGSNNNKGAGVFYVSDADEPFEAVALGWDEAGKGLPDEGSFLVSLPRPSSSSSHSLVLLFHPLRCQVGAGVFRNPSKLVEWMDGRLANMCK